MSGSADVPSARVRVVIAATSRIQPNVRIMAEQLAECAWQEDREGKAYRSGEDGERVCVRFSASAHGRDIRTLAESRVLIWAKFPRGKVRGIGEANGAIARAARGGRVA